MLCYLASHLGTPTLDHPGVGGEELVWSWVGSLDPKPSLLLSLSLSAWRSWVSSLLHMLPTSVRLFCFVPRERLSLVRPGSYSGWAVVLRI